MSPARIKVEAVIFDLDGVLVDTEPAHLAVTRALIAPAALRVEEYERFIGRGGFKEWLEATYGIARAEIDARSRDLFNAELERNPPTPLPGAVELIEAIAARGLGLAVASQSSREWVEVTLRAAGLSSHFPLVVSAETAGRDKPAPDVYLLAARLLEVAPRACIAIEDSVSGIASARAAGMWVVQSRQASFVPPPQPEAHAVIASLQEFDLAWLDGVPAPG